MNPLTYQTPGAPAAPHNAAQPMHISRFFGHTNREAMRQVRMALGAEALIVSNRRVNGGVEILAADATQMTQPASPAQVTLAAPPVSPTPSLPPHAAHDSATVMQAITGLRSALELRIEDLAWNQQVSTAPQTLALFQTLLERGFSTTLLRLLLQEVPAHASEADALAWARAALCARVPMAADEDALWQPGLTLALVGPTGVGKTTTLAKLAARAVRRFGAQNVTLITTDTYRIGASEQLKIYGQVLRTAVHVAHDAATLQRMVQALPANHVVLIDNVGVSQRDRAVQAQAALLRTIERPVTRLLVLNAASHGDTLDEVARTYANDGGAALAGCIVSKVDEALRLAPVLDTTMRHQLPIHFVSTGQKVPEHLACLSAEALVDQALAVDAAARTLYAPCKADLAALMRLGEAVRAQDTARMLHDLITLSQPAGAAVNPECVRRALREMDAHPVCRYGFEHWQALRGATPAQHDRLVQEAVRTWLPTMRTGATLLALHAGVKCAQQGKLYWTQTGILTRDAGFQTLSIPVHTCVQTHAWVSSGGERALESLDAVHARLHQVRAVQAQAAEALHVFAGGSPRLWRGVQDLGVAWLGTCTPGSVVVVDETPTRAATLARQATYQPLDTSAWHAGLQSCAGRALAQLEVWVAVDAVHLRGHAGQALRLIHVRLQDRTDGSLVQRWSALACAPQDVAALAHALVVQHAQATLARTVSAAMQHGACAADELAGLDDPSSFTPLALDLALAVWCIQHSAATPYARQALASFSPRAHPTARDTVSGLLRLFALQELLA